MLQAWALRQREGEALSLAEYRRQQLAMASHDLRQPLASFEIALQEANSRSLEAKLRAGIDYLNQLLERNLSETHPPAHGALAPDNAAGREAMPIQVVFDNLDRMFQTEAAAKGVKLSFVASSAVVVTEPLAMLRILSNLISNAIKYTDEGRVLVGVRRRSGKLSVEVWDSGPGISRRELQRVQARHQRGDTGQAADGHGLGLAIAHDLAKKLDLTLHADSWVGQGTVFRLGAFQAA